MHDVAVQHDKIRREPGREPSTRVLREGRISRVVRHAPQSLRARQRLGGVPVVAWRCAREKGDETNKRCHHWWVVWNREVVRLVLSGTSAFWGDAMHEKDGDTGTHQPPGPCGDVPSGLRRATAA